MPRRGGGKARQAGRQAIVPNRRRGSHQPAALAVFAMDESEGFSTAMLCYAFLSGGIVTQRHRPHPTRCRGCCPNRGGSGGESPAAPCSARGRLRSASRTPGGRRPADGGSRQRRSTVSGRAHARPARPRAAAPWRRRQLPPPPACTSCWRWGRPSLWPPWRRSSAGPAPAPAGA